MAPTFRIKQGDLGPPLDFVARIDKLSEHFADSFSQPLISVGSPRSLIGATAATFVWRLASALPAAASSAAAVILTPDAGQLRYVWGPTDTDVPGDYYGEFRVTMADGTVETFPKKGYIKFIVEKDLDT